MPSALVRNLAWIAPWLLLWPPVGCFGCAGGAAERSLEVSSGLEQARGALTLLGAADRGEAAGATPHACCAKRSSSAGQPAHSSEPAAPICSSVGLGPASSRCCWRVSEPRDRAAMQQVPNADPVAFPGSWLDQPTELDQSLGLERLNRSETSPHVRVHVLKCVWRC